LAATRQPPTYDPRTDTLSALAAEGAVDRWIMTLAFAAIGLCYVLTAIALREPALPGRAALALGGMATALVAVFPQPAGGTSDVHGFTAMFASSALAVWPALATRRGPWVSWPLRPVVSLAVSTVLIGLLIWFGIALQRHMLAGLFERTVAGADAFWLGLAATNLRRPG
jgi:hypothetical membrane protein